jgi:hypothetical protein
MQMIVGAEYESDLKEHVQMGAQALVITKGIASEREYKMACEFLVAVDEKLKGWEAKIAPSIKTAHQLHKQLNDLKNEIGSPLRKARIEILQPAILKWEAQEREKARIEQERINRELRRQEEARRLELAAEMEKSGKVEEANALIEEPIQTPDVVIARPAQPQGIQSRTLYSAEVVDLKALCRAVADGLAPAEYVMANMPVLNSLARNLKESVAPQWDKFGIKVRSAQTLAVGGR